MANELRKTLGRNMRYAAMNKQIDSQIQQLQARAATDLNAQSQINALQQQRAANLQQMSAPMNAQEYNEYDDNGYYIGNSTQQQDNNSIGQMMLDGVNHFAQGTSLGWSDEMMGVIGGTGRVIGNGIARAKGYPVNGETFSDAWNNGYQEYRDYARQELQDGYRRNPGISASSEMAGSVMSPVTPFRTKGYTGSTLGNFVAHSKDIARARTSNALGTGVINGIGYTNDNNLNDYMTNIGMGVATNYAGNLLGNWTFGSRNLLHPVGRGVMNGIAESVPYTYNYNRNNR